MPRPRGWNTSRPTTRSTSTASPCATARGCSPPSTFPRTRSKRYPILLMRTPYSVKPYGVDQYKSDLGPSPLFGKAGYIFAYQDVRGRWMSEGEFVNMRPHNPAKKDSDIDESSDTYDTIDWLIKHVPEPQRQGRPVGHLLSRLLHGGRHDRRPSGPEGGLAAGARHRLVHRRRLAPQRRPVPAAHVQLHGHASAGRAPEPTKKFDYNVRSRHARRLRVLPAAWARWPTPTRAISRATSPSGTRR